jgi:hypothetical protein
VVGEARAVHRLAAEILDRQHAANRPTSQSSVSIAGRTISRRSSAGSITAGAGPSIGSSAGGLPRSMLQPLTASAIASIVIRSTAFMCSSSEEHREP